MTFLPDINFWLALAFDTHDQHPAARAWISSVLDDSLAFCRLTQNGFLRIATNSSAFPHDAKTMIEAWTLYDRLRADQLVVFASEPVEVERHWRQLTQRASRSHHLWADAYLAAFAIAAGYEVVTFDREFAQFGLQACTILV